MHRLLKERGFYEKALYANGYAEVLRATYRGKKAGRNTAS
jgi:hypothetical protein